MKRSIAQLESGELTKANWLLKRVGEIMRLAEGHWTVLETMSAVDFLEFRGYLTGVSGASSANWKSCAVSVKPWTRPIATGRKSMARSR